MNTSKRFVIFACLFIFTEHANATNFIQPKHAVTPFLQWESNAGYCGEVSILQAGMNQGQWMNQYNARLICGSGLSQSGPDGFCAAHRDPTTHVETPNQNAQVLLEEMLPGDAPFASASLCLRNARLAYETYPSANQPKGMEGYKHFLSWIKAEMIKGSQVTIGVRNYNGDNDQYDHEVSVSKVGTNHSITDPTYYDDDILFFDDHSTDGRSFLNGYTFKNLSRTRKRGALFNQNYTILVPGKYPVHDSNGGDGIHNNPRPLTAANYGFAVSGPSDSQHLTLPVTLTILETSVHGIPNHSDVLVGFNFESPAIDQIVNGKEVDACTNAPPSSWMEMKFKVDVTDLIPGTEYNLYEYAFDGVSGFGDQAALPVPESNFNANAQLATEVTHFTASSSHFTTQIETTSDKILVFRCVPASAP